MSGEASGEKLTYHSALPDVLRLANALVLATQRAREPGGMLVICSLNREPQAMVDTTLRVLSELIEGDAVIWQQSGGLSA